MDETGVAIKKKETHPRSKASFLSDLFFCWEIPIIVKGFKKELNEDDLYEPLPEFDSKKLTDKLERNWQEEVNFAKSPSFWRALFKTFGLEFMFPGLLLLPFDCFSLIIQPFAMIRLLDFYTPHQTKYTKQDALLYSSLIAISVALRMLMFSQYQLKLTVLAMKMRVACSSLIYRKCLTLKRSSLQEITVGHIVNLQANDIQRFDTTFIFLHFLWIGPLNVTFLTLYLYFEFGPTTITSLGFVIPCIVLICLLLVNWFIKLAKISILDYVSKKIYSGRSKAALETDFRIRLLNDIISGIKTIKMYTWEKPFSRLIGVTRKSELNQIRQITFYQFLINSVRACGGKLFILPPLLFAILTDASLTSQYVFVLVSACEVYTTHLVSPSTRSFTLISELCLSVERIQRFLLTDNPSNRQIFKRSKNTVGDCCISKYGGFEIPPSGVCIKNVSVKWDPSSKSDVLKDIEFEALPGELIGVIGAVGSGKSTLLQTILKETIVKGRLVVGGLISYAPQEPWVFPATVRQNILFGQEMDRSRYLKIVQICALEQDFSTFPGGDRSLVGERGVKLSGGQKSRIGLARAVYRHADIYLLDDPLSAVDTQVGNHIFTECILDFLKDKCVILITHQLKYLENCKKLYILDDEGRIKLIKKTEDLSQFAVSINQMENATLDAVETISTTLPAEEKEHRSGNLSYKAYKTYCQAGGNWCVTFANLFILIVIQFISNFYHYFLSIWVNLEQDIVKIDPNLEKVLTTMNCLYICIALLTLLVLLSILKSWSTANYVKNASKNLHNDLLKGVLDTTMTFFNNHSSGRILNRFSGDIGLIDGIISWTLQDMLIIFLIINGTFILVAFVNYWMLIPVIVIYLILVCFWIGFEPANKHIKKTEMMTKSPILTYLTASLEGLPTIRAFNGQKLQEKEFDNHQNLYSSASYLSLSLHLALVFWSELIGVVYIALVVFGFFLMSEANLGYIALAITQANVIGLYLQYWIKVWSNLDIHMTSVERVKEYSGLPPEKDTGTDSPPETWPNTGDITFQSVSMKYSEEGSLVLKTINFHIDSGAKIGIVGRTGAGKSSLISALFRLFDFEGKILIDGVDTKTIPLNKLRSQISIIPQEPVLFLGTLRKNLDLFDEFTDEELWDTLEKIELKGAVSSLDCVVSEGGANFSVGQRQLLCLGRVMLRKNKIIILDEATANVDFETDELIQKTIRQKFEGCTVLTIAHRINTVMDSDKVLVLEAGEVVEFDRPSKLLQNENGLFFDFVNHGHKGAN